MTEPKPVAWTVPHSLQEYTCGTWFKDPARACADATEPVYDRAALDTTIAAAREEARREALEEAAKVCEDLADSERGEAEQASGANRYETAVGYRFSTSALRSVAASIRALAARDDAQAPKPATRWPTRWRNAKTGAVYREVARGLLSTSMRRIHHGDDMVAYQSEPFDGRLYVFSGPECDEWQRADGGDAHTPDKP